MKGTAEDRRILRWCLAGGAALGGLAAAGAAFVFDREAAYRLCDPADPLTLCRHLEVAGFELTSGRNAAAVVGPIIAFLAFVFLLAFVLLSHTQQHPR